MKFDWFGFNTFMQFGFLLFALYDTITVVVYCKIKKTEIRKPWILRNVLLAVVSLCNLAISPWYLLK